MRLVLLTALGLVLTACSAAAPTAAPPTANVTGPNADTDTFGNSRVKVEASTDGVTQTFTVTSGSYLIQYLIDSGQDTGCSFLLILTPAKDGPIVQSTTALLPNSAEGAGDVTWTLTAGTYLLQEDETGTANCHRGFQANVTAQN